MNRTLLFSVAFLGACAKPPPEAPKELGELGAFLFANFMVEDEEGLADYGAGLANLRDFLQTEDFALDAKDRAFLMPILKGDDLGELSIPAGADAEEQDNVALSGYSTFPVDDARPMHIDPNQICIESSTTVWAGREVTEGGDCWVDGGCDRLETVTEVRKENFLAKVWYDQHKVYRVFEIVEEDDSITEVIVGRAWIDKVFEADGGGGNSWDQLFQVDISIPNPDEPSETLRWFSMWSSITLGGFGDDLYKNTVISGIDEAYAYADAYMGGNPGGADCPNDRSDFSNKPERQ